MREPGNGGPKVTSRGITSDGKGLTDDEANSLVDELMRRAMDGGTLGQAMEAARCAALSLCASYVFRVNEAIRVPATGVAFCSGHACIRVAGPRGECIGIVSIDDPREVEMLEHYVRNVRPILVRGYDPGTTFFVNSRGVRMGRKALETTLQGAASACGIDKPLSPWTIHRWCRHRDPRLPDVEVTFPNFGPGIGPRRRLRR